jgi:hypothetical protein
MTDHLPSEALEALIELGSSRASSCDPAMKECLARFEVVNRLHFDSWCAATETLSPEAHAALARGLVLAEEELRWCGGSVAAAIWVYRSFARKFPDISEPLAEWMLSRSTNPWVPFGSNRGSARSVAEVRDFNLHRAASRVHADEESVLREELAEARRSTARRLDDLRQKVSKAEGQARQDMLSKLAILPLRDRLLHIADDELHPLHFYPTELATGSLEELDAAGEWALARVKEKASLIPKGPWRKWLKSQNETWETH